MTEEAVQNLIQAELATFTIVSAELLKPFLIRPLVQVRQWEYAKLNQAFPVWVIADFGKRDIGLAFSEFTHHDRWGIIRTTDQHFGGDDSWFLCLEDAFIQSGFYTGNLPNDYEIR